ncbi:hypothetical protein PsorP6_000687 [Peronosclerospora sorghi]|uniref:Uncharacterized protein n=1 Tax=Peronosclerospora sorghi TaxID=230839 RepID=A0ACC0WXW0_9STRA|nr:hypothetical protein PsorP6_000687 [Peronosclerospora sorghi]
MTEFIPSGVIEKAFVHDMIYPACPKCFTSMASQLSTHGREESQLVQVQCLSCGVSSRVHDLKFKYRMKLQLICGSTVTDAMLFDEVAESLLGVSALQLKCEILPKFPNVLHVLEEVLLGLRVSFSFHHQSPKRNVQRLELTVRCSYRTHLGKIIWLSSLAFRMALSQRDLKVVHIAPVIPQQLPEPAATYAIKLLRQRSHLPTS